MDSLDRYTYGTFTFSYGEKYQGEYIVRGGKFKKMLGNWDYERTVVIKFPSYDKATDWYLSSEYEPVKKIREDNLRLACFVCSWVFPKTSK